MDKLVHPDCRDPAAEFDGWINVLILQSRESGASDREMVQLLRRASDELSDGARG